MQVNTVAPYGLVGLVVVVLGLVCAQQFAVLGAAGPAAIDDPLHGMSTTRSPILRTLLQIRHCCPAHYVTAILHGRQRGAFATRAKREPQHTTNHSWRADEAGCEKWALVNVHWQALFPRKWG